MKEYFAEAHEIAKGDAKRGAHDYANLNAIIVVSCVHMLALAIREVAAAIRYHADKTE